MTKCMGILQESELIYSQQVCLLTLNRVSRVDDMYVDDDLLLII